MKFYILEKDYLGILKKDKRSPLKINQGTAVVAYKKWFFDCLSRFGKIVPISEKLEDRRLNLLLGKPDAMFSTFKISGYLCYINHFTAQKLLITFKA